MWSLASVRWIWEQNLDVCCFREVAFRPLSHWKVSFESCFQRSTFERKLSDVNGPLSKVDFWKRIHLIQCFLGQPESSNQTASRSVQPFLQGSLVLVWQTDRQTDHATRPVTVGRIYVRSTAMRPINNSINLPLSWWSPSECVSCRDVCL